MNGIITYLFTVIPLLLSLPDFALVVAGGFCMALMALLIGVVLSRR